jgi:hypothetical protein
MFGHDNDDENKGQITLPPTDGYQGDDHAAGVPADDKPADTELGNLEATPAPRSKPAKSGGDDDLLNLKQEALQALTPLVDHLEQTPEERFRTTMMMIQAADNQSLIRYAYEAALKISNEKERAQALLDIVNEINYFTQQNQ